MHVRLYACLVILLSAVAGFGSAAAADTRAPIVVELFTSQGCSSCPPADAYLRELAARGDVIALSFHVDYWDYIGWKDPFAHPAATRRQKAYAASFGKRQIYTPQMVIDGQHQAVGSDRRKVRRALDRARRAGADKLAVTFSRGADGKLTVNIPEGSGAQRPAKVWMVLFDRSHTTSIGRGENSGRTLAYTNVVREIRQIGEWNGKAMSIALRLPASASNPRDVCAVIVQLPGMGRILGAAVESLK